jgi:hypothetical protein
MLCILKGQRPLRPMSQSTPCVVQPSATIWELITHCWDAVPDSRPVMSHVLGCLKVELGSQDITINDKVANGIPGENRAVFRADRTTNEDYRFR